jgi:hypothetical protein
MKMHGMVCIKTKTSICFDVWLSRWSGGSFGYQEGYLHVVVTKLSYALVDVKRRREFLSDRPVRCRLYGTYTTCRLNECYPECLQNLIWELNKWLPEAVRAPFRTIYSERYVKRILYQSTVCVKVVEMRVGGYCDHKALIDCRKRV